MFVSSQKFGIWALFILVAVPVATHTVDATASANLDPAAAAPSERTRLFKENKQVTYESLTSVEKGRVDTTLDYADMKSKIKDWDCSIHSGGVYCEDELGSCWCDWNITPPSCGCSD